MAFTTGGGKLIFSAAVPQVFPQWWGAKGNATTDNTAAIQAALNAASASGGEVYFATGTYRSNSLVLPANISIRGAARGLVLLDLPAMTPGMVGLTIASGPVQIHSLTIRQIGKSPAGTSVRISGTATAYHTVLQDLEIASGGTAVEVYNTYGIVLRDMVIRRFSYGVRLHDNSLGFGGETTTITIDDVSFTDWFYKAAIDIVGAVTNVRVRDSIVQGGAAGANAVHLAPTASAWPTAISFDGVWFETGKGTAAYDSAIRVDADVSGHYVNGLSVTNSTFGGGFAVSCINIQGGSRFRLDRVWNASSAVLTSGVAAPPRIRREEWNSNLVIGIENVPYGTTVTFDATRGSTQWVSVSNSSAFAVAAPLSPTTGAVLTECFRNTSGNVMGAVTFNEVYKTAAGSSWDGRDDATPSIARPIPGSMRCITFVFDSTHWVEIARTPADVPY